jgi:hypothetical protein
MIDSGAMPSNKKKASHSDQESTYAVGDRVKVNMHRGRIVEAEVKAVVEKTHGVRLQVSFGNETALIYCERYVKRRGYGLGGTGIPRAAHRAIWACFQRSGSQASRSRAGQEGRFTSSCMK